MVVHWWTDEPRNEARYEPGPVYEARRPIRGSYGETGRYKARKELFTSLVERRGAAQHVRGSYVARLRGSYRDLADFSWVDVWPWMVHVCR